MAGLTEAGEGREAAAGGIVIDDQSRAKARAFRSDSHWDAAGTAEVSLPAPLAEETLAALGYRPAGRGGWVGPDGERYGSLGEALGVEFTAAGFAAHDGRPDPAAEALGQIRRLAAIPVGQTLLDPDQRIRALTTTLGHIEGIAADGRPDRYWRPRDGQVSRRFGENVDRLRRDQGLSVDALAARSNLDPGDLGMILNGERRTVMNAVMLLSGALGVSTDALFEGIGWDGDANGRAGDWVITGGGQDG